MSVDGRCASFYVQCTKSSVYGFGNPSPPSGRQHKSCVVMVCIIRRCSTLSDCAIASLAPHAAATCSNGRLCNDLGVGGNAFLLMRRALAARGVPARPGERALRRALRLYLAALPKAVATAASTRPRTTAIYPTPTSCTPPLLCRRNSVVSH